MELHPNIPLKNYLTMRIGGPAKYMTDVHTQEELVVAVQTAKNQNLRIYILGGGSNVIAHDSGFDGLVIRNKIMGFSVLSDDTAVKTIKVGAGENWDSVVARTVAMNLTGIEALSGIPGTAGASPVQNIGAYGQEVADTLVSLEAYDTTTGTFVSLTNVECGFSYRHSIFRGDQAGRYIITSITLQLFKSSPQPPFYAAIQTYFDRNNTTFYTADAVRKAVLAIRTDKLPNPAEKPNSGSFFKNAMVEDWQLNELSASYPDIPHYDMGDGTFKVPTGWLIEKAGLKGALLHGMRVHDKNALVLINESATGYSDLEKARGEIIQAVRDTFRVAISQEPLEI